MTDKVEKNIQIAHPDNVSKTFCGLAFKQLHVTPSGVIKPCCLFDGPIHDETGKTLRIGDRPLEDIWNTAHLKEIRLKMMKGEEIRECSKCIEEEKNFLASERILKGYYTPDVVKRVENAQKNDGGLDDLPDFLDLKMGNTCNLKCRMCQPLDSISIDAEFYQISKNSPQFRNFDNASSHDYFYDLEPLEIATKWIETKLAKENVEKIISQAGKSGSIVTFALAGGEVTYTPSAMALIDFCIEKGYAEKIEFVLSTNLTNISDEFLIKLSKFKRTIVICSIDGVGKTLEYIRYPSKWNIVHQGYLKLLNGPKNIYPILAPTIQIYNILEVVSILELLPKVIDENNKFFNSRLSPAHLTILYDPHHLNLRFLPVHIKQIAYSRIFEYARSNDLLDDNSFFGNQIKLLLETLKDENVYEESNKYLSYFLKYTEMLDESRSQKFSEELPELAKLLGELNISPSFPKQDARSYSYYRFRENGFKASAEGDHLKASKYFRKAFELSQDDEDLLFNMALNFKALNNPKKMEELLLQTFAVNPKHYYCLVELGFMNLNKAQHELAKEYFFLAMNYEPAEKKGEALKNYRDIESYIESLK